MFVLLVAAVVAVQEAPKTDEPRPLTVEESHDRIKDESQSTLMIGRIYTAPEPWRLKVDLSLARVWQGAERNATQPGDSLLIRIETKSRDSVFSQENELAILAGTQRFRALPFDYKERIDEEFSTLRVVKTTPSGQQYLANTTRTLYWNRETLTWSISFGDLQRLIGPGATFVEMSVGQESWRLDSEQLDAIRGWAARMAVSSSEADRVAMEQAKAKANAVTTARARLDPYRADVEAAVEKARSAKRTVPKSRYATVGEKLKWRTFDREIQAVRKKHNLSDGDIEELLKDYPDFRARNKIQ